MAKQYSSYMTSFECSTGHHQNNKNNKRYDIGRIWCSLTRRGKAHDSLSLTIWSFVSLSSNASSLPVDRCLHWLRHQATVSKPFAGAIRNEELFPWLNATRIKRATYIIARYCSMIDENRLSSEVTAHPRSIKVDNCCKQTLLQLIA